MVMRELQKQLQAQFELTDWVEQRPDLAFVTVRRDELRQILLHLRDQTSFTHLVLLTAVDWLEDGQFQLTYLLNNRNQAQDIGLRLLIPRDQASMESIHDLWPTAATYQRELREMFGIDFPMSPRVDEEFILEGWTDKPPYRRDFDTLAYAEATYNQRPGRETRDPEQYMKEKLYPDQD
jgi:NADH-quinone oxidoreductase subunit C